MYQRIALIQLAMSIIQIEEARLHQVMAFYVLLSTNVNFNPNGQFLEVPLMDA